MLLRLETIPPATSSGHALYVGDFRIPKYWQCRDGIYFKIYDPQFFTDHAGEPIRFSANGVDFIDTGLTLTSPDRIGAQALDAGDLPEQDDVLR